ncbi:SDR family NAD(P)-dependent oxidoreductase [Sinosporangium siamense]|uniref:Short-chain dehydrogenase/reductase n=1 Tax=Sinosporangium siamense TaxID=1367973 RepID=A0A919RI48_9ACTN|nr:SDR family NAD(P)-dependent oxidoreductase [Sinosporangium siamense]GII94311.1 putative short-chain dehydrogenase/reductase [Sinosporangium siamense]
MGSLDGRVILITGAGRGIGREEALLFAAEGAKIVVNDPGVDIDGSGGDGGVAATVVEEIRDHGGEAVANTDSVADWRGAERMVGAALEAFGDLHVVVNNATIERNRGIADLSEEDFDDVVAVKLKGTFAVTHWAARYWREQYHAGVRADRAVVNTSSGSGLLNPLPLQTNYASGNAGVAAMTVVAALELGRYGVRVNCISPSMARTRLTLEVPGMDRKPEAGEFDPLHPATSAPIAAYLATEACALTGQVLSVRGGTVAVNHGWSRGAHVQREGGWTVAELADEVGKLPMVDPFDHLAEVLGKALGVGGRDQLQAMINNLLDQDR